MDDAQASPGRRADLTADPLTTVRRPVPSEERGRRPRLRLGLRALAWLLTMVLLITVLAAGAVQTGLGDGLLAARVRAVLANTVGPDLATSVRQASIRIGRDGRLAIEADDVRFMRRTPDGSQATPITTARSVRLALDPLPLLSGQFKVADIAIDGITVDARMLRDGQARTDWDAVRIDALGDVRETLFEQLDGVYRMLSLRRTEAIRLTGSTIIGVGSDGAAEPIQVEDVTLSLASPDGLGISGRLHVAGQVVELAGTAARNAQGDAVERVRVNMAGLERLGELLPDPGQEGRGYGLDSATTIRIDARRQTDGREPSLTATARFAPGRIMLGGVVSDLAGGAVELGYFEERRSLEILPSFLDIGDSTMPFSGGIIDLSNLEGASGSGFGIDFLVENATAAPTDSTERPLDYQAQIFARFLKQRQQLSVDEFMVNTHLGSLFASAEIGFQGRSPEISFAATIDRMETAAVKQLWPHWIAKRPRAWAQQNVVGGTVTDGAIRVFIPRDRLAERERDLGLSEDQLQVSFDLNGSRINIAGDIPPVRDTIGRLSLKGERLEVAVDSATAYFPSGRSVSVTGGTFAIPQTERRPLMAEVDIGLSGAADAVAELISYRPIAVLDRIGYPAEAFSGEIAGSLRATFGLIRAQEPPPPVWSAEMRLSDVALAEPFRGREVAGLTGTLAVDNDKAVLDAAALIDGAPFDLDILQPVRAEAGLEPQQTISGTLDDAQRERIAPGLDDLVSGPVGVAIERTGESVYAARLDLGSARLTVPGLRWTKAPGIAASADMAVRVGETGVTLDDLALTGEGFSLAGSAEIADGRLASARFDRVRLSERDDYAVTIARQGGGYAIDVGGAAIDLRALLESLRSPDGAGSTAVAGSGPSINLTADIETAHGFNGETLSAFNARYQSSGGALRSLDLQAVTSGGAAVVANVATNEEAQQALTLTSGDAGAFARFANIYGRISGGQINLRLAKSGDGPYAGTLDLNNFSVINEEQLRQLIVSRASNGAQSLNEALGGRLNANAAAFDRGFARLSYGSQGLAVDSGVVRGPEIGATFQGVVFDAEGRMNITGTFMPAYGLNRLFAEIPIFGSLLGNGRDRGLFGITFMLAGPTASPQLTINPISAIAPGVFRQIFEF